MTLALAVFSCLWSLAEANGHADTFADVALKSASLPRRLGELPVSTPMRSSGSYN